MKKWIKMKFIRIVILFFLGLSYSLLVNTQTVADNYEKYIVKKNNIKKKIHHVQGVTGMPGYISLEVTYNNAGLVLDETSYRSNGKIAIKRSYKYDPQGNIIEYTNFDGNRNKTTYQKLVKYTNGNKSLEVGFDGVDKFENKYSYDSKGNLKEIRYTVSNNLTERREVSYSGNKQSITVYKPDNSVIEKQVKIFDPKKNLVEDATYSNTGTEKKKTVFTFNEKGDELTETKYYSGKISEKLTNEYNNGRLAKVYKEGPDVSKYMDREYKYDSEGKLIEERWIDKASGKFSTKSYKYDTKKNIMQINSYFASYNFGENVDITYEYY